MRVAPTRPSAPPPICSTSTPCRRSWSERPDAFGRLDVLINNASSFYPTPLGTVTAKQWDDLMGTNLRAPLFLSQAAAPALKETHGLIINMIDIHAQRPLPQHPVYSTRQGGTW